MRYSIIWSIDIEAETPRDAAEEALKIHRDPESTATCFEVMDDEGTVINIDLLKDPERPSERYGPRMEYEKERRM